MKILNFFEKTGNFAKLLLLTDNVLLLAFFSVLEKMMLDPLAATESCLPCVP